MTQAQLAGRLGVSQSTMSKIESGKRNITTTRLVTIARLLNVKALYLLGRCGSK